MSKTKTLFLLLAALAAALALAACGGGDDDTTAAGSGGGATTAPAEEQTTPANGEGSPEASSEPAVPTIVVRDGEPVGGVQELEFTSGDEIRFKVESDAAEEIHVHGYDIAKEVPAGGSVEFAFPAEIEGIFEAELEELGVQIAELRVNP